MSGEPGAASAGDTLSPNLTEAQLRMAAAPEAVRKIAISELAPDQQESSKKMFQPILGPLKDSPKPLGFLANEASKAPLPSRQSAAENARLVMKSGDPRYEVGDSARAYRSVMAEAVARHIAENRTLDGIIGMNVDVGGTIMPVDLNTVAESMTRLMPDIVGFQMTPKGVYEAVNSYLSNPRTREIFLRNYAQWHSEQIPDEVTPVHQAYQEAWQKSEKARARGERASKRQEGVEAIRRSLDPDNPDPNSDYHRFDRLSRKSPRQLGADADRAEGTYDSAEAKLNEAIRRYGTDEPDDSAAREQVGRLREIADQALTRMEQAQRDWEDYQKIKRSVDTLDADAKSAQAESDEAENAFQIARGDVARQRALVQTVEAQRRSMDESRVTRLENMVADSIREANIERAREINAAHAGDTPQEQTASGQEYERGVSIVKSRYQRVIKAGGFVPDETRRSGMRKIKTDEIVTDVVRAKKDVEERLLSSQGDGPRGILREMLMWQYRGSKAEDGTSNTVGKVDEIMSDTEFCKTWEVAIGRTAMDIYLQNGGEITQGQADFLALRPRGREIIEAAIKHPLNKKLESEMKQIGELPQGGLSEAIKDEKNKGLILKILNVAAGTMLPTVGAAGAAVAGTAKGKGH